MLTIYCRHLKSCDQTSVAYRRCKCPIHVRGTLNGQRIKRQSLDLINWEKAQEKVRQSEGQGHVDREAVQRYFQDLEDRGLAYSTIRRIKPSSKDSVHQLTSV